MNRIETGTVHSEGNDAVFLALTAKMELGDRYGELQGTYVDVTLMQHRWDGRLGFAGGKVDKGETLQEALIREVKEEMDVTLYQSNDSSYFDTLRRSLENATGLQLNIDITGLKPVCSHEFEVRKGTMNTHLYTLEVPFEVLKDCMTRLPESADFGQENNGGIISHLANYRSGSKGFNSFMKHNFATTVLPELYILADSLDPETVKGIELPKEQTTIKKDV